MTVKQILLSKMEVFCYIIADDDSRKCALIDPAFDTDRILAEVSREGLQVAGVINTHGHSDHCAGNSAIIEATGATLYIHHADAKKLGGLTSSAFSRLLGGRRSPGPDVLLKNGDSIDIGNTRLTVIHTPGHTPGGACIYMPGHVFTGDTLFVGAVGRTDLPGGSMRQLLDSIRQKIYTLPGDTRVWPGHDYGDFPYSSVEQEKQTNPFTGREI